MASTYYAALMRSLPVLHLDLSDQAPLTTGPPWRRSSPRSLTAASCGRRDLPLMVRAGRLGKDT